MKTFNLLSIGQRGVGKTVFLAGSYAELHPQQQTENAPQLWFDCQDLQVQENIDNILNYVAQTCQYPPPTMKITDFSFTLKQRSFWGVKALCRFHWYDVPGEICNVYNSDFKNQVLNSHGCCVFINAKGLVQDANYLDLLEDIITQVSAIADLVTLNHLKYAFAFIYTQCDQLELNQIEHQKVEKKLQPLISYLEAHGANYRQFNSAIPIVSVNGSAKLKPAGAAAPLIWLNLELRKLYKFSSQQDLEKASLQSLHPRLLQATAAQKLPRFKLVLTPRTLLIILALVGATTLGVIVALHPDVNQLVLSAKPQGTKKQIQKYEQTLQQQPNNIAAATELSRLYIENGQPEQAIPLLEKVSQQNPKDLNLLLDVASLYEITNRKQQAETIYDQVLDQEKNNVTALLSKAILRNNKGDRETAKLLFTQAETAVAQEQKSQVRALAQMVLQSQVNSKPSTK